MIYYSTWESFTTMYKIFLPVTKQNKKKIHSDYLNLTDEE